MNLNVATTPDQSRSGYRNLKGPVIREYYYYVPPAIRPDTPVIVAVHGISRNAAEHLAKLRPIAEEIGAVIIAPYFSREHYPRYQLLADPKTGTRSDLALIDIMNDIFQHFGMPIAKFYLVGFSGGAQFAHRFALYHSNWVRHCISCSAGWYTYPNFNESYPLGIKHASGPDKLSVHHEWSKVKHDVIVGSNDTLVEPSLNMTKPVIVTQGVGRRERAHRWVKAMNEARRQNKNQAAFLTEIDGLGHDFSEAHDSFNLDRLIIQKFEINKGSRI